MPVGARRGGRLLACFQAMTAAYLPRVAWEPPAALEARAAHLLPALLLARVDGKSPVEYITTDADRDARPPGRSARCSPSRPIGWPTWPAPGTRRSR